MQENNTPRRRRSETFRQDAETAPEKAAAPAGSEIGNLRPPSAAPVPGGEYRYSSPDLQAASDRGDYAPPSFSRQTNTMYSGSAEPSGADARPSHETRRTGGTRSRSSASSRGKKRGGKRISPWVWAVLALLVIGTVLLILGLSGCRETVTYVKGERELERDRINGYNMGYSSSICRYCAEYDMPPAFVAAIIKNESSYDRFAENSHTHARGLMQLMSATAGDVAGRLKIENFQQDMLFEADTNIRMGTYYLRWISVNYFKDDYILITSAYHAGQGNVKSWLKKYSSDGKTLTLEQIPTSDTRSYATKVMGDFTVYANHIYNFNYYEKICECSARYGLPSALVAAVVKTGSLYDENAVYTDRWRTNTYRSLWADSAETAEYPRYGLMQLSPEMIRRHAPVMAEGTVPVLNADENLDYGCAELREMMDLFGGDTVTALCAYRAGRELTLQWISASGSGEGRNTITLSEIPSEYAYVREYIEEVTETYDAYKPFYTD